MDQANIVIQKVHPLKMPKVVIETNERKRYTADLSEFKSVYCFPKTQAEWENVSVTEQGFNLTWGTRFEVHVDQVVDSATAVEDVKLHA